MISPLLVVTNDEKVKQRTKKLAEILKVESREMSSLDDVDIDADIHYSCVIVDCKELPVNEIAGSAQVVSQVYTESKTILIVGNKLKPDEIKFIYTSGAKLILTENDYINYSKIDFYLNYVLNNTWVPVKAWDFVVDTTPDFNVFHYIPYKNKYFPLIFGSISDKKLEKMKEVGEIYIHREDLASYNKYITENQSAGSDAMVRRCRAKYIQFYDAYVELLYQLSDESKHYTFEEGKKILENVLNLAKELIQVLSAVGDPSLVVDNMSFELDGPLSRIPAVAAYAGVWSMMMNTKESPEEVMLATLVSDLGLLKLSPNSFGKNKKITKEDEDVFENHPQISINTVLERKLPINEGVKSIIMYSHGFELKSSERNKLKKDKMPLASQIIMVATMYDKKMQIQEGCDRPRASKVKAELLLELSKNENIKQTTLPLLEKAWKEIIPAVNSLIAS